MRSIGLLSVLAFLVLGSQALASANSAACKAEMLKLNGGNPPAGAPIPEGSECQVLSDMLLGDALDKAHKVVKRAASKPLSNADVEPSPVPSGTQGGPAQSAAVPSVQPTPLASTSISAVNTQTGSKAITELKINPLGLGTIDSASHSWASRTFDFVIDVPTSSASALENGKVPQFDYLGVKLRVNFLGFASGKAVFDNAKKKFSELLTAIDTTGNRILDALETATDVASCAAEVKQAIALGIGKVPKGDCGADVALTGLADPEAAFHAAVVAARQEADSRYFGLDVQTDFGDPRFTGLSAERGTRVVTALSFGQQAIGDPESNLQVRGRLGASYTRIQYTAETTYGIDAALGFVFTTSAGGSRPVGLNLGFEGKASPSAWGLRDTNYMNIVTGVTVPITEGAGITVGANFPVINGDDPSRKPIISVSGDWELLLRGLSQ